MAKTKLLYILPEYDPNTGSHLFHIFELLEELSKKLDIFLLVERGHTKPTIKGIHRVYSQKTTIFPFNLLERTVVIVLARLKDYKTVYVHYSYFGALISAAIMRPTGGKVFYWHCEYYQKFYSKFNWTTASLKKKLFDEWMMTLTLKCISTLVTCTSTTAEFYEKILGISKDRIKIIPNWINLKRFKKDPNKSHIKDELQIARNSKVIIFVHHLSPRKGADFIVPIAKLVTKKYPSSIFLVIGDGPSYKDVRVEVEKNRLSKKVRMIGSISNVNIPKYFSVADIFIMPSRQEGFARVLLEAMVMEVPFVVSGRGGAKDILTEEQKKLLVPIGDIAAFSDKISDLLTKPQLRRKMIKEGKTRVKKYTLEHISDKFYNLLRS